MSQQYFMNQPFWMYYGHQDQPDAGLQTQQPLNVPRQGQNRVAQAQEPAKSPATSQPTSNPRDVDATFTVSVKVLSPSNKKDF